jgi:hypothetical protein
LLKSKKSNKTYFSIRRGQKQQKHQARGDLVQRRSRPERSSRRCPRFRAVLGDQPVSVTRQTSLPQTGNDPRTLDPCRRYVQAGKFACKLKFFLSTFTRTYTFLSEDIGGKHALRMFVKLIPGNINLRGRV